jgi:hypothetical protein
VGKSTRYHHLLKGLIDPVKVYIVQIIDNNIAALEIKKDVNSDIN